MNKQIPSRSRVTTAKVKSPFGSLYVHVSHNDAGHAIAVGISSPGKFSDTEVGETLTALAEEITAILNDTALGLTS